MDIIKPPCFTEQTYRLWLQAPVKAKHTNVCDDCTHDYQQKMCSLGRCINPSVCAEYSARQAEKRIGAR